MRELLVGLIFLALGIFVGAAFYQALDVGFSWQDVRGWQTGIGAVLGFVALAGAAWLNARFNNRRDDRLRMFEGKHLAIALAAEIETLAGLATNNKLRIQIMTALQAVEFVRFRRLAPTNIYESNGERIGMLTNNDLISGVIYFYRAVQNCNYATSFAKEMKGEIKQEYFKEITDAYKVVEDASGIIEDLRRHADSIA